MGVWAAHEFLVYIAIVFFGAGGALRGGGVRVIDPTRGRTPGITSASPLGTFGRDWGSYRVTTGHIQFQEGIVSTKITWDLVRGNSLPN